MMNAPIFHYFHKIISTDYFNLSMKKVHKTTSAPWVKKSLFLLGFLGLAGGAELQAQFWTENFGSSANCASMGQQATAYTSPNGPWTVTADGVNGPLANVWYVSATAAGGFDPDVNPCGSGCIEVPALDNQSLHIGKLNNDLDDGARYNGFGNLGPTVYTTAKRAESPTIDCTDKWSITLDFWYVAWNNGADKASLHYFDGTTWTPLADLTQTVGCPLPNYAWAPFQITLPSSANNNPNVKIGFKWDNNSDGVVGTYSVAIDNIRLSSGPAPAVPVAGFEVLDGNNTFCEQSCTTMNDLTVFDAAFSTGAAFATYEWQFPGGNPATSSAQNPSVCYDTPGPKNVTLTVTDNIGASAPVTISNIIIVQDCGPDIAISASNYTPCSNEQCVDFTDLSETDEPGGITAWLWTFTSPSGAIMTSTLQNPTNICLNEVGFYDVTLAATDADLTEEQTFPAFIEVLDCSGPDIDFSADRTVICPDGCIQLTDNSTSFGTITAWNWSLPGGQAVEELLPDTSTQQNPIVCYSTPGMYNITLSAVDQEGVSAITKTISILVDPCTGPPDAAFVASADTICTGDCVDFTDQSLGLVENYLWVFQGTADINDATSTLQNPSVICYSTPGTYNVTLTVSNSNNQVDNITKTDFIVVEQCISKPVPRISLSADTICAGQCVDYTSTSTGIGISDYQWNFQGAVPGSGSSTVQNPSNVCYNTPGTYDVSLFIEGVGGDSVRVFEDVITVISTPACRPTIEVALPDTICAGDCPVFSGIFTDADSVRWTFQGGNPETSKAFNPGMVCFEEPGNYMVLVEAWNPSGGAQPVVHNIFVGERPPLNAGPDKTINSGAVVTLTASLGNQPPIGSFLWQPFDLVSDFTAQIVTTTPDETTDYIVYYKEPGGCTAIDTVKVIVNFVAAVGVPSTFSPNGDGQNDVLRVLGQGISRMEFKVFNRYGQLVFETNNQVEGWDGLHNGKEVNPGTYVYTLEVTFAEGESEVYTGNVTLVK